MTKVEWQGDQIAYRPMLVAKPHQLADDIEARLGDTHDQGQPAAHRPAEMLDGRGAFGKGHAWTLPGTAGDHHAVEVRRAMLDEPLDALGIHPPVAEGSNDRGNQPAEFHRFLLTAGSRTDAKGKRRRRSAPAHSTAHGPPPARPDSGRGTPAPARDAGPPGTPALAP